LGQVVQGLSAQIPGHSSSDEENRAIPHTDHSLDAAR